MIKEHERDVLRQFREELWDESIISPGDTIGTDDWTLLLVKELSLHVFNN